MRHITRTMRSSTLLLLTLAITSSLATSPMRIRGEKRGSVRRNERNRRQTCDCTPWQPPQCSCQVVPSPQAASNTEMVCSCSPPTPPKCICTENAIPTTTPVPRSSTSTCQKVCESSCLDSCSKLSNSGNCRQVCSDACEFSCGKQEKATVKGAAKSVYSEYKFIVPQGVAVNQSFKPYPGQETAAPMPISFTINPMLLSTVTPPTLVVHTTRVTPQPTAPPQPVQRSCVPECMPECSVSCVSMREAIGLLKLMTDNRRSTTKECEAKCADTCLKVCRTAGLTFSECASNCSPACTETCTLAKPLPQPSGQVQAIALPAPQQPLPQAYPAIHQQQTQYTQTQNQPQEVQSQPQPSPRPQITQCDQRCMPVCDIQCLRNVVLAALSPPPLPPPSTPMPVRTAPPPTPLPPAIQATCQHECSVQCEHQCGVNSISGPQCLASCQTTCYPVCVQRMRRKHPNSILRSSKTPITKTDTSAENAY